MPRDYYEILGISRDASEADVKKAYRKLARQYHPDRNPGDKAAEAKFKEVQEAYAILGDKQKKTQYDTFGKAGAFAPEGFAGFPPGGFPPGFDPEILQSGDLSELLGGLFGRAGQSGAGPAGRRRKARPPQAAEAVAAVPFLVAANGGSVSLDVDGRHIDLKVPAGVESGQKLRLAGQGSDGGDLLLTLDVQPHPYFRREGKDVVLSVPLALAEAVLGAKVEVPALDGSRLTVKVPAGASSGSRLRLKGKGVAGGDQYIEIKVVVPKPQDDRSRELIEEFARLNPQQPRDGVEWA